MHERGGAAREPIVRASARQIVETLGLEPLLDEGGLFHQTFADEFSTAVYYLLVSPEFSALHRLSATEVYHWYSGDPLQLVLIRPDGTVDEPVLGSDLAVQQRPQIAVPAGTWHGSWSTGSWTLVGTTMAPGFTWQGFTLADRADLLEQYPHAVRQITALTRT